MATFLDRHFPTHHLWAGDLSLGEVVGVWWCFVVAEGDHRLYRLQPWTAQRLLTRHACLGQDVRALDFQDERLAAILDALAQPEPWQAFEQDLNQHTVRVDDRRPDLVRLDSTTASS